MKFYDKNGGQHDTLLGAYIQDVKDKFNTFLDEDDIEEVVEEPAPEVIQEEPVASEEDQVIDEIVQEVLNVEPKIDYAHNQTTLVDDQGNIIASSEIPENLESKLDSEVKEVVFGNEEIPDHITLNSNENVDHSTTVVSNDEPIDPEPIIDNGDPGVG